jgi:hypothetical protein
VLVEVLQELLVLGVAEAADRLAAGRVGRVAPRQADPAGGQEAGDAVVAGLAVDVAQVVALLERAERLAQPLGPLLQISVEQALPGGRVHAGGVGQHPVGVEHHRFEREQATPDFLKVGWHADIFGQRATRCQEGEAWRACRSPSGRPADGDDDLAARVALSPVPDRLGDLAQRVGPVDQRRDLAGLDQLPQALDVLLALGRDQPTQPLTHER